MAVLQALLAQAPEVVSREDLINTVWGNESGGDESLSRAVSMLRKALGDHRGNHTNIETIPRRGYRLAADLHSPESPTQEDQEEPDTRWLNSRRTWIAIGLLIAACAGLWFAATLRTAEPNVVQSSATQQSIAVLPFVDLSAEGDQGYFADGLSEEILNALMRLPNLSVAGRTSSFAYKDQSIDLRKVGDELGVSHVLEGSVRRSENRVRVTTQLIRTTDGYHAWSETFDEDIVDLFDLQESIAQSIAKTLSGTLGNTATPERLAQRLTDSQDAYDAFLQGRVMSRQFGKASKHTAIRLLQTAVDLDPQFAEAWAMLARAHMFLSVSDASLDQAQTMKAAKQAIDRALEADPDLAMGHYVYALIQEYDLDYPGVFLSVKRAYALDPNQPFIKLRYGNYLSVLGHTQRGEALIRQALQQDPTDAAGLLNLATGQRALGNLEEAERLYRQSYALGFNPSGAHIVSLLGTLGRAEEAMQIWQGLRLQLPNRYPDAFYTDDLWRTLGEAAILHEPGAVTRVRQETDRFFSDPKAQSNSYRLGLYQWIGVNDAFMQQFIDKPFPVNSAALWGLWSDEKFNRELRRHPDFPAFLKRLGFDVIWQEIGWPEHCNKIPGSDNAPTQFSCR